LGLLNWEANLFLGEFFLIIGWLIWVYYLYRRANLFWSGQYRIGLLLGKAFGGKKGYGLTQGFLKRRPQGWGAIGGG